MQLNLEDVPQISESTKLLVKPCSVNLHRCDIELVQPLPRVPVEANVVVQESAYDLRKREQDIRNPATSTCRAKQSASLNVSYVSLFDDSSSEETSNKIQLSRSVPRKQEPSRYRLAAHKYMLAKKRGLITSPSVRTYAFTTKRSDKNDNDSSDSDATIILNETSCCQLPKKKPIRGRNPKTGEKSSQKHSSPAHIHSYEGGTKPKKRSKIRKPYLFKCLKCDLKWPMCKERNDHFKRKHRKLQCTECRKFFRTPSAYTLHRYNHKDGQFECKICKASFPFRSQLDHHMVSHRESRDYKCKEPFLWT